MSQLDLEIKTLYLKIASLEEQKRIEAENLLEKKAFPLKTLQNIIDEKKLRIERNFCSPKEYQFTRPHHPEARAKIYDQEKVDFLEPILNMLKNIYERLETLEKK